MIPLPDPDVPQNSPSHPNAYPEFPAGSTVMALYPDTSCFYRAEVTEDREQTGRVSAKIRYPLLRLTRKMSPDPGHVIDEANLSVTL